MTIYQLHYGLLYRGEEAGYEERRFRESKYTLCVSSSSRSGLALGAPDTPSPPHLFLWKCQQVCVFSKITFNQWIHCMIYQESIFSMSFIRQITLKFKGTQRNGTGSSILLVPPNVYNPGNEISIRTSKARTGDKKMTGLPFPLLWSLNRNTINLITDHYYIPRNMAAWVDEKR